MQATLVSIWGLFAVEKTLCIIPITIIKKKYLLVCSAFSMIKPRNAENYPSLLQCSPNECEARYHVC